MQLTDLAVKTWSNSGSVFDVEANGKFIACFTQDWITKDFTISAYDGKGGIDQRPMATLTSALKALVEFINTQEYLAYC